MWAYTGPVRRSSTFSRSSTPYRRRPAFSMYSYSAEPPVRTPASITCSGANRCSGTSGAGPSPSRVRSTIPWNDPDGKVCGVYRSGCASIQRTVSRSPYRARAAAIGATSTPQSPPVVTTTSSIPVKAFRVSRKFSTSTSSARTPAFISPSASSTGTVTQASAATSSAVRLAPATSRGAPLEPDPCHCGTQSTVVMRRSYALRLPHRASSLQRRGPSAAAPEITCIFVAVAGSPHGQSSCSTTRPRRRRSHHADHLVTQPGATATPGAARMHASCCSRPRASPTGRSLRAALPDGAPTGTIATVIGVTPLATSGPHVDRAFVTLTCGNGAWLHSLDRCLGSHPLTRWRIRVPRDGARDPPDSEPSKHQKKCVQVVGLSSCDDRKHDHENYAHANAIHPIASESTMHSRLLVSIADARCEHCVRYGKTQRR